MQVLEETSSNWQIYKTKGYIDQKHKGQEYSFGAKA